MKSVKYSRQVFEENFNNNEEAEKEYQMASQLNSSENLIRTVSTR
jgi:hypothetical protein